MNKEYKPIDCNYYDVLVLHAMRGDILQIITDEETIIASIIDLETIGSEEFLILDKGQQIRLDKIKGVTKI